MPTEQPLTELTTRDVLLQVDRRLTLIEDDLRTLDQKWDQRFGTLEQKTDTRFDALDQKIDARFDTLDQKTDAQTNQLRNEQEIKKLTPTPVRARNDLGPKEIERPIRSLADQKIDARDQPATPRNEHRVCRTAQGNEHQISLDARRRLGQLDFHHRDAVAQVSSPIPQTTPHQLTPTVRWRTPAVRWRTVSRSSKRRIPPDLEY